MVLAWTTACWRLPAALGCESLHLTADPATGLRAIVAVHSTVLGPVPRRHTVPAVPRRARRRPRRCRLARGMTYKHAACGNDQGGGKAVIIGDPAALRSDDLLDAYGRFIDQLGGIYLTAEDVGTTQADMDRLRTVTPYVTGTSESLGGSGDPSPATAWGVFCALAAVGERTWGGAEVEGRHVVVLGTGKVGSALARHLHDAGARLTLADTRADAVAALAGELGADVVAPEVAHTVDCDVLAPVPSAPSCRRRRSVPCGAAPCAGRRTTNWPRRPTPTVSPPPASCTPPTTSSTRAA